MTIRERLFGWWYPALMRRSERAGQAEMRRQHLAAARGRTLEIGVGNGFSLPHYTDRVDELVLGEPHPGLRGQLEDVLRDDPPAASSWTVVDLDARRLPFPDASFDTVTASYLFCSLDDPAQALTEVHRVLRPGGTFLFHEHVRGGRFRGPLQDVIAPLQVALAAGCRPHRDFEATLAASPLHVEHVDRRRMPRGFPTVVPIVIGSAIRPPAGRPASPRTT